MTEPQQGFGPTPGSDARTKSAVFPESPWGRRKARLARRGNRALLHRLRLPAAVVASGAVSAAAAVSVVTWYPQKVDHGIPATCHSGDPLAGVHQPWRLTLVQPCGIVTGTVECVRPRTRDSDSDGDATFNVRVNPPYGRDLTRNNAAITCPGSHAADLHVEILAQQCDAGRWLSDTSCANRGGFVSPTLPRTGDRVLVIGPVVHDRAHAPGDQPGWTEIHPAERVAVLVQAPPSLPNVVAPDPEMAPSPPLTSIFPGHRLGPWPHQGQGRHSSASTRHAASGPSRRRAAAATGHGL